jgi:hypothetical protein
MIKNLFIYHLLLINTILTNIFLYNLLLINTILTNISLYNLILIILKIYIILILFMIDINRFTIIIVIVINTEKHTILVGGICHSIQFMDLGHIDLLSIIIIYHRNGTKYLVDNNISITHEKSFFCIDD